MTQDNVIKLAQPGTFSDPLTEILRNGARALLAHAVEAEVAGFLGDHADKLTADGRARLVRHGRLCMSNNAAERELRSIALGRRNWTFAGSDEGGWRAAAIYTLIATAKLNDVDPQAWLADVLARLPDHPAKRISELLPWNWRPQKLAAVG